MMLDQVVWFVQEWDKLIALLLFCLTNHGCRLLPSCVRIYGAHREQIPGETFILTKEQVLIDRYKFVPSRGSATCSY